MTKLKAKSPDVVVASKPKFLISGKSGVGKTLFALSFPKPYLIDCEGGATREQYQAKLKAVGGAYMGKNEGSQNFQMVIDEVKTLATEKHDYKTLIIDSFTYLYMLEAAKAELNGGSDFGRDKKEANKPTRQLIAWLEKTDMTIILVCHSKEKWKRIGKEIVNEGTTFDGYDKLEYILDLWIEIASRNNFIVKKSRIDSLKQDEAYDLKYEKFAELYGKDVLEKDSAPIVMVTAEQIGVLEGMVEVTGQDKMDEWLDKVDVTTFAELSSDQAAKIIDFVQKKFQKTEPKTKKEGK